MTKKEMFKYIINETQKVISLIGLRRAGKTFYFYQLINNLIEDSINPSQILYINFEDDRILPLNVKELNTILEAYYELYPENTSETLYLFFDEIQNIHNWELFIRRVHDKKNARIYITGSSSKLLSKEIATSLRGRTLSYYLFPLSFEEFLRFRQVTLNKDFEYTDARFKVKKLFSEYLGGGGFPEVVLEAEELRQDILRNYFEMFIYRDLVERFSIRNISLLKSLVKFLITNIGTTFSVNSFYRTIKKDMPVGKDTLMEYLSYLEDINLIYLVPHSCFQRMRADWLKTWCSLN
jgi:predicted AAA+ superfamily ATPase